MASPVAGQLRGRGAAHRARDAEVGHQRVPALQQDVFRLDIAVNELVLVRIGQRIGHLARDAERLVHGQLPLPPQAVAERLALDIRHHVVEEPVRLARIVEREDVRVPQPRRDPDLPQETLGPERSRQLGPQHLQRHRPPVPRVLCQVDHCHPARPQLTQDQIARRQRRLDALERRRHRVAGSMRLRSRSGTTPGNCGVMKGDVPLDSEQRRQAEHVTDALRRSLRWAAPERGSGGLDIRAPGRCSILRPGA